MKEIKLFKTDRCSQFNRPLEGELCFFSPVTTLVGSIVAKDSRPMLHDYLRENNLCRVVRNSENVVYVKFSGQKKEDMVCPDFLIPHQLTQKGKELFEND